jgi:hypothetical protein
MRPKPERRRRQAAEAAPNGQKGQSASVTRMTSASLPSPRKDAGGRTRTVDADANLLRRASACARAPRQRQRMRRLLHPLPGMRSVRQAAPARAPHALLAADGGCTSPAAAETVRVATARAVRLRRGKAQSSLGSAVIRLPAATESHGQLQRARGHFLGRGWRRLRGARGGGPKRECARRRRPAAQLILLPADEQRTAARRAARPAPPPPRGGSSSSPSLPDDTRRTEARRGERREELAKSGGGDKGPIGGSDDRGAPRADPAGCGCAVPNHGMTILYDATRPQTVRLVDSSTRSFPGLSTHRNEHALASNAGPPGRVARCWVKGAPLRSCAAEPALALTAPPLGAERAATMLHASSPMTASELLSPRRQRKPPAREVRTHLALEARALALTRAPTRSCCMTSLRSMRRRMHTTGYVRGAACG